MQMEIDVNKFSKQSTKRGKARRSTKLKIRNKKRPRTFKIFSNSNSIIPLTINSNRS